MAFAFGRSRRLRKHPEFVRAQRLGQRVSTAHFILLVSARADRTARSRLGLVVAKRVGNAVQRNRVKRLCREVFRMWPDLLPPGVDLVVIARPGCDALGLAEMRAEWRGVERLLRKRTLEALARGVSATHSGGRAAPAIPEPAPRAPRGET
jgi:ribonuclease P protein component